MTVSLIPLASRLLSDVKGVNSNAEVNYGGADNGSGEIRVKENASYDVWGDDWSGEEGE
ncbi:MAG: hypothetical protein K5778_02010 [Bacteroidaceae bacterium]|nr:hypothetical protein [Bacteroidaceae bacterium]